ncbi:hypothetical protein K461DRAFT_324094 [Myriangium duriaei CBS 260.36]|uniref:Uncharacterized protein n=1 Tax=Myriangium duriaei CBS 260.36 TaxID=1168546 RepID=A0A9P4IW62_9PEZI|nr:hypothetical protein K461DRAFT_324094 [Myriangium duriaei CBS 260.36]
MAPKKKSSAKKKRSQPDRPTFSPEPPPNMQGGRLTDSPSMSHVDSSVPVVEQDPTDEHDGSWRYSKGILKNAPDFKPYKDGGSPFRCITRVVNGQYQLGCEVDPQYLRDTGKTYEEAIAGPLAQFDAMFGNNSGTMKSRMRAMKAHVDKITGGQGLGGEGALSEAHAKTVAPLIKANSAGKEKALEEYLAIMAKAGGTIEGYENFEAVLRKEVMRTSGSSNKR